MAVWPRDRSDAGAEGAVAVLGRVAGASAGFCSKIVLEHVGGQGMRAPCHAQATSFGGFVASGRWQTDEPCGAGTAWPVGRDTLVAVGQLGMPGWPGTVLGQIGSPWPPTAPLLGFPPRHRGWGRVTVLGAWGQPDGGPGPHGEAEPGCWVLAVAPGWRRWQGRCGSPQAPSVAPGPHPRRARVSPAPSLRSQPAIPAETKVPHPGEAGHPGAGVPHPPGLCSITAGALHNPPQPLLSVLLWVLPGSPLLLGVSPWMSVGLRLGTRRHLVPRSQALC